MRGRMGRKVLEVEKGKWGEVTLLEQYLYKQGDEQKKGKKE